MMLLWGRERCVGPRAPGAAHVTLPRDPSFLFGHSQDGGGGGGGGSGAALQVVVGAGGGPRGAAPRSRRGPRAAGVRRAAAGGGRRPRERQNPHGEALLGRGTRAAEADPHEPVHHVHGRQHYLHLPRHDGLHDGLAPAAGPYVPLRHTEGAGELEPAGTAGAGVPGG